MNLYTKGMTGAVNPLVSRPRPVKGAINPFSWMSLRTSTPTEYIQRSICIDIETRCWVWTRALDNGYGRAAWNKVQMGAHRLSYETYVGQIPDGLVIDHLCRNKACVNPDHLEPVTAAENTRRGNPNTTKTHCKRGHAFDAANTRHKDGKRQCIICGNASSRRRMAVWAAKKKVSA